MISSYFKQYVIMNVRRPDYPTTTYFDRKSATKEELIAHCGVNGQHCGYFYGDPACPKCYQYELNKRADIIKSRLSSEKKLFVCELEKEHWGKVRKQFFRIKSNYIWVPINNGFIVVVSDKRPKRKDYIFAEISSQDAISLLTTESYLFPKDENGSSVVRGCSRAWSLTE